MKNAIGKRIKIKEDLNRFAGKWVAFVDGKVTDSADKLPKLMLKIKQKKLTQKASLMLVPRNDEGPYVLKICMPHGFFPRIYCFL